MKAFYKFPIIIIIIKRLSYFGLYTEYGYDFTHDNYKNCIVRSTPLFLVLCKQTKADHVRTMTNWRYI